MTREDAKREAWRMHSMKVPYKVMAQRLGLSVSVVSHLLEGKKKRAYRKTAKQHTRNHTDYAQRGAVPRKTPFFKAMFDPDKASAELARQISLAQQEAATAPLFRPTLKGLGF